MKNTTIWDGVCKPPQSALKEIKGGRLKGMTDINPQWRYRAMTETFGVCGFGWVYTIDRLWTEKGVDAEVMAFAQVSLKVKTGGEWSEPIVGIGGSALIARESGGPKASDECYKMAITDALSVAMKMLGVGADIYMGRWDGSKYKGEDASPKGAADADLVFHLELLEAATTIEALQTAFARAYKGYHANEAAVEKLVAVKERRKAALSAPKPEPLEGALRDSLVAAGVPYAEQDPPLPQIPQDAATDLYEKADALGVITGQTAQEIVKEFSEFKGKSIESIEHARRYIAGKPDGKWVSMTTMKIEDAIREHAKPKGDEIPEWAA